MMSALAFTRVTLNKTPLHNASLSNTEQEYSCPLASFLKEEDIVFSTALDGISESHFGVPDLSPCPGHCTGHLLTTFPVTCRQLRRMRW